MQTYQHGETHRHIHIDGPSGQFYDQQKNPITQEAALDRAMGAGNSGDVERAVKDLLTLINQTAEPLDPPDHSKFYSRFVHKLLPVMNERNEFLHKD